MITIENLIGKNNGKVKINTNDEYMNLALQITAEWENIVNSGMVLRDDDGNRLYLRKDERIIEGVDF